MSSPENSREDDYRRVTRGDMRLLLSLWPVTRDFRPLLAFGILMIMLVSLQSIMLPYLTKVAIDSYILPLSWKFAVGSPSELPYGLRSRVPDSAFLFSGKPGVYFLGPDSTELIDAREERGLREAGFLSRDRYYLKRRTEDFTDGDIAGLAERAGALCELYPGAVAVPERNLPVIDGAALLLLRGSDLRGLKILGIAFGLLMVLGYFFDLGQRVVLETASQKLSLNLRRILLDHLFGLSQGYFDRQEAGRLTSRLTSDINNINQLIKSTSASFFSDLLSLTGVAAVLFMLSPRLAAATLLMAPLVAAVSWYFSRIARDQQRDMRGKISEINQFFSETRAGMSVIKAFRHERESAAEFGELNLANYRVGFRQVRSMAVFLPLVDLIANLVLAVVLWVGGLMVLDNAVSLGVLAAFIGYANRFFAPIKDLAEKVNSFQSAFASLERIHAVMTEDERTLPVAPVLAPRSPGGQVSFRGVSFRYSEGGPLVLDGLDFEVRRGETLAIVGETGSGKSSVISLMLRFYDPTEGEILFDGDPLKRLDLAAHRRRIGLVTQDVYLYSGTVMDNLRLGREDLTEERIRAAAEKVGAARFIERLPAGYGEKLGSEGRSLSAGQRQLIACARALIDAPDLVILDEATAFVDSESELLIAKAMNTLFEGRTSVIIAHRLSTVRRADRIMALSRGRIAEEGTHEELLARKGIYYRLAQLQGLNGTEAEK
ncbi:MAG: ABC transporter ATP-binding protein/permease [Deltaproteobacteria bacterium]|jgi:ABC-type multidrug transport system fused ATPase/permease subunit|nr:ABC transporter ATP-binding protein/permease [Deltaproteobacteria bacterium]